MTSGSCDEELGMQRKITRRDFLDGAAMAVSGFALSMHGAAIPSDGLLPTPALSGLRAIKPVFEYAHVARKIVEFLAGQMTESDLIVGAGISGLAAAYFYRKGNSARILFWTIT
jgi:spermidine dehydrogenase